MQNDLRLWSIPLMICLAWYNILFYSHPHFKEMIHTNFCMCGVVICTKTCNCLLGRNWVAAKFLCVRFDMAFKFISLLIYNSNFIMLLSVSCPSDQYYFFAFTATAQLSCHVQNFLVTTFIIFGLERNEISMKFQLLCKKIASKMGSGPSWDVCWPGSIIGVMFWVAFSPAGYHSHGPLRGAPGLSFTSTDMELIYRTWSGVFGFGVSFCYVREFWSL